jgi:putative transposase
MQPLWQHRYWEHVITSERDFRAHVDYIHYNPVRHGYVGCPGDWQWSSFGHYVRRGLLDSDWGASGVRFPESVGREYGWCRITAFGLIRPTLVIMAVVRVSAA